MTTVHITHVKRLDVWSSFISFLIQKFNLIQIVFKVPALDICLDLTVLELGLKNIWIKGCDHMYYIWLINHTIQR